MKKSSDVKVEPSKVIVLEVLREEEFSALKNAPGSKTDCPDTARSDLSNMHKSWVRKAGGIIKGDCFETTSVTF